MTEAQIIEKLKFFKDNLLKFKNERNEAREERNNLQKNFDELNSNFASTKEELEEAYNDLKTKSYHSIKHLVEDVIEKYEKEIDEANASFEKAAEDNEKLLGENDRLSLEIKNLKNSYSEYISPEEHQKQIEEMSQKTSEADSKTQTVLETTWKEQKRLEEDLRSKNKDIEDLNNTIKQLNIQLEQWATYKTTVTTDIENLHKEIEDKDSVINEYKSAMSVINSDNTKKINQLNTNINALEDEKKNLTERVNSLEEQLRIFKEPKADGSRTIKKETSIGAETVPFRFGRTSTSIMDKVKQFISYMYISASYDMKEQGTIILGNPDSACSSLGLSSKEYEVFMDRLQRIEYDGIPLIYEQNGIWKTKFEKNWLLDYISSVIK